MSKVFEFRDYKDFLRALVGKKRQRRGIKTALAKAAGCQGTYLSLVLYGSAHLSLEQLERIARYLALPEDETRFLLLLLQAGRAGSKELRAIFTKEIEQTIAMRMTVAGRLGEKAALSPAERTEYYSSWQYAAVHVCISLPNLHTSDRMAKFLGIPLRRVEIILQFLLKTGLLKEENGKIVIGATELRLANDGNNIIRHHTNWRMRAIDSLEQQDEGQMHYSAAVTISAADALKVKDVLLEAVKKSVETIRGSKDEEFYGFTIDFFNMRKVT